MAAPTITYTVVNDWTAIAQGGVFESTEIDTSANRSTSINIQAFLDTTTAHTGTEFKVQYASADAGNEDWVDLPGGNFVGLIGTANSEAIVDNPLAAAATTINLADTTGYTVADIPLPWRAIEDGTLINSELVLQKTVTANDLITIVDGVTNEHAQNVLMYNIALSTNVTIPIGYKRVRVLANNNYDSNGSTLNVKVMVVNTTAV
jgi:hypothetical protein